eukprot:9440021-Alexandrium_andersonii.AAC.1
MPGHVRRSARGNGAVPWRTRGQAQVGLMPPARGAPVNGPSRVHLGGDGPVLSNRRPWRSRLAGPGPVSNG